MSFLEFTTSLSLLTIVLSLQNVLVAPTHECLSSRTFTGNDPYEANLKNLMNYLSSETPSSGFGLGYRGDGHDKAYGLALCLGYASPSDCTNCVANITNNIFTLCPKSKGAVVWYRFCMLKYLDENFFGQIDNQSRYLITDGRNASDPVSFTQSTTYWMNSLVKRAPETPEMYAISSVLHGELEALNLMVQCTRDLSIVDCGKCLSDFAAKLPTCCAGKKGATIFGASCLLVYQTT